MQRTGLEDISQIKDPLLLYNWALVIPNIPGGGNSYQMTLRCQTTAIPGLTFEEALVQLRGMELVYAGRPVYSHNLPFTMLEARDMITRQSLLRWFYTARDFRNNTGSYKEDYSTTCDLELYDDAGLVVRTIRLFGVWPKSLDDLSTESSGSTVATFSGTLSFDWFRDIEDI